MASEVSLPQCRVCQTPYKYGGPDPYLLPCLHSVCQSCLESNADGILSCSVCQETFFKTYRAKDAVTAKAIFLSTAEHHRSEMLCTNRGDNNQAMSWCPECEAFLCDHCQDSHSENKSSRKHDVKSVEQLVHNGIDCQKKQQCHIHKDYPLVLYDHDCEVMLCLMCRVQGHKGCEAGSIEEVYRYLKGHTLPEYISKLTEKMGVNNTTETALTDFGDEVESCRGNLKVSIRNTFQELHQMLQEREQEVTLRLDQHLDALKKESHDSLSEVRLMTERCDTVLDFSQRSLKLSTPADLFNMKKTIEARTTACTRTKLPFVRSSDSLPMFTRRGLDELKSILGSYTCISGDYPDLDTEGGRAGAPRQIHDREKQVQDWKNELEKVEKDISALKLILDRHERHTAELKRNLNIGSFRQAVASIMNTIRGRRSYSVMA